MKNYLVEFDVNKILSISRVLAIYTVILAHSRNADLGVISVITERIGTIGIVLFFFISGYYFHPHKVSGLKRFIYNKVNSIFIPWFFMGTFMFFISMNLSFHKWIDYIIGNGTYLYFLSVLVSFFFIFYFVNKSHIFLYLSILINIISLFLTSFNYIEVFSTQKGIVINNYLNIFNWIGFFSFGILSQKWLKLFIQRLHNNVINALFVFFVVLIVSIYFEPNNSGYFSKFALPVEIFGCIAVMAISTIKLFDNKLILRISSFVFAIYLTHFLIFPIKRLFGNNLGFEFLNPLIILLVNYCLLYAGIWISKKIKMDNIYKICLGIRLN